MNKKSVIPVILLILSLAACAPKPSMPSNTVSAQALSGLFAEAHVMPVDFIDLSFGTPGQVEQVLVKNGDSVKAGQVLARLGSSSDAEAALAQADQNVLLAQQALDGLKTSAALNLSQAKLAVIDAQKKVNDAIAVLDSAPTDQNKAMLLVAASQRDLAEKTAINLDRNGGIDSDQWAVAQYRLESANAQVKSARAAINSVELKSTIDGTVTDLTLEAGQRVTAGQPVITVADYSKWVIKTDNLTEANVARIQAGQKATVTFDAVPGTTIQGQVQSVNMRYEELRGDITYTVTVNLIDPKPQIRWGMTAAVQFVQ